MIVEVPISLRSIPFFVYTTLLDRELFLIKNYTDIHVFSQAPL